MSVDSTTAKRARTAAFISQSQDRIDERAEAAWQEEFQKLSDRMSAFENRIHQVEEENLRLRAALERQKFAEHLQNIAISEMSQRLFRNQLLSFQSPLGQGMPLGESVNAPWGFVYMQEGMWLPVVGQSHQTAPAVPPSQPSENPQPQGNLPSSEEERPSGSNSSYQRDRRSLEQQ